MSLPVRVRVTLAFAVAMAFVLAALGGFVYWRLGRDLLATLDLSLRSRAQVIVTAIAEHRPTFVGSTGSLIDVDEAFAQVLDGSGGVIEASSPKLQTSLLSGAEAGSIKGPRFADREIQSIDTDPLRILIVPVDSGGQPRFVLVGATLGDRQDALDRLLVSLVVAGPVALLLTSFAGWLVTGAALRPVEAMRREAAAISVSEPERRLPVPATGDELARLGSTLNAMLDRMRAAFERERRFVDDASHELRTPLGILKMELDLALARARTPKELEAVVRGASEETDRLARLAEDLLVLARAERGQVRLAKADVSLDDVLGRTMRTFENRARGAGVRIELDASGQRVRADADRLRQAVENLLDNAIRHSTRGGVVMIRADRNDGSVAISVEDAGPGFPPEFLNRAFDAFARGDPSDRDGHGAGLGLAIVRAVAEAHGGSVWAENLAEGGARVTLVVQG
jgi:two-component system, OmpR family, sensor kinase